MLTRRRFLELQAAGFALSRGRSENTAASLQIPSDAPHPVPLGNRDYWNDWPDYLAQKAREARAMRAAGLASIRTAADVRARQERVRAHVWKLIGGPFQKTSLNARTEGG